MELSMHVNDKLKLYSKTYLSSYHYKVINLLYQPLMGVEACNLYFTLWNFVSIEKGELTLSHRQLLTFFNWDLKKFIEIRQKLEAIDLVTIYYSKNEGYYLYELKQPLNAKQFFQDSNLNVHLLYQVGDNLYHYLENKFIVRPLEKNLVNITKNFEDVYQIIDHVDHFNEDKQYMMTMVNHFTCPINYDFDYELFTFLVSRHFVDMDKMNDDIKEAIVKEAALYHFDAQMMSKIVLDCVEDHQIDVDKVHNTARNYYKRLKTKKNAQEEMKSSMTEAEFNQSIKQKKKLSQKEQALKNYKTKSPLEWLRTLQHQTEIPSRMLDVVKVLSDDYKLPSEVINVLIEFVRVRNDGRLPLEYTKMIASSWVFKQVKTAEKAMEMVEKMQSIEKEYTKRGEVAPTYRKYKGERVVKSPDWMKEHQKYRDDKLSQKKDDDVDMEELQNMLESFK